MPSPGFPRLSRSLKSRRQRQGSASYKAAPQADHAIHPERLIDWRRVGVEGGIPSVPVTVELRPDDLPVGEDTNAAPAIQRAIDQAPAPGAVLLPEGTFHITSGITLRSGVVLRGRGLDKTHLLMKSAGDEPAWGSAAISLRGEWAGDERRILAGYDAGSRVLVLESADDISPGQMVYINSENDMEAMYGTATYDGHSADWMAAGESYARRTVHQVLRVLEVRGDTVVLDAPVRLSRMHLDPRLRPMDTIEWAGVESLHIRLVDPASNSVIAIGRAENCWVRDCELEYAHRTHISLGQSRFITVESNYIHHAHGYGGGGRGYGVVNGNDCLIWNNVFRMLRHAMLLSNGANGSVWAFNYSREQHQDGRHRLRDISVHGHYPYMTLFEGNVAEFATSSDWWGSAGPLITFFRNRFDTTLNHSPDPGGWNPPLQIMNGSHRQNVVGNSMISGQGIDVKDDSRDALVEGNLIEGRIVWNEAVHEVLPVSLFLEGPPHFWGDVPWPAIGADVDAANAPAYLPIPAQVWGERILSEGRAIPFSAAVPTSPVAPSETLD